MSIQEIVDWNWNCANTSNVVSGAKIVSSEKFMQRMYASYR